jgi:hypothetical protein
LGSALGPKVGSCLIEPVNGRRLDRTSERERDVLDLMTQGHTKVAIATRLSLVATLADRADRRLISTWRRSTIAVLQLDPASFTGQRLPQALPPIG